MKINKKLSSANWKHGISARWISKATWPDGETTSDEHDTEARARAVCKMLQRDGACGLQEVFPTKTWIAAVKTRAAVGCTDLVRCVVTRQGGPILNEGYVVAAGENVVAIEIDMRSKRCEVVAESATEDGAPVIWLDRTNALHLKKGREKEKTEVVFQDYKGWRIFSAHVCRYTFRVCFVRDEAPNDPSSATPREPWKDSG